MKIKTLTGEALTAASAEDLSAALSEARERATALFALEAPTVDEANEAVALVASIQAVEAEEARRAEVAKEAERQFAAARQAFSGEGDGDGAAEGSDEGSDDAEDGDDGDEGSDEGDGDDAEGSDEGDEGVEAATADGNSDTSDDTSDDEKEPVVTASRNPAGAQRINPRASVAKKVGSKTKRPAAKAAPTTVITASADVPNFGAGSVIPDMDGVRQAVQNRVNAFPKFNRGSAEAVAEANGGEPVLHKFGTAAFSVPMDESLVASQGRDYAAVQAALKQDRFSEDTLTAGGWCAPSEPVYSYIADYVVDGLVTVPEVSAPRGGLLLTTGPARSSQGDALDEFGFVQTEAEAISRVPKTCETIVCPNFTDHRLDAIGYCYKIPLLTEKAYPELVTDALRFAGVLYAHKVNERIISDMVALSTAAGTAPLGASFTDTLEALSIVAVKERRKWNIGENAVMEVKIPQFTKEVFRADLSRRNAVALDAVTDEQIAAHFSTRRLAVEYVADWQEITGAAAVWPSAFQAMIFPAGTFIKAVEDVINLSSVYDAASLSINEYTGVFFEQGIMVAKAGYGSTLIEIPICTAGFSGAAALDCDVVIGS